MVFLIMGSILPGYMFRYQYCLVGGLEAIVLGSIRWCVWSFRPSSPLRLPHLKCLLLLKVLSWNLAVLTEDKIVIWENILQYYDVILCQEWGRSEELSELLEHLGFNVYFNDQSVSKGNRGDPPRGAGKGEGICVLVKKFL